MSDILVGEAIQLVQSMYSKGVQSKDSRLSSRQIYSELLIARSAIIRQQANKKQDLSNFIQSVQCIELVKAAPFECPCVPPMGTFILKTKYKVPNIVDAISKPLIYSVTTLDGSITFDPTEFHLVKYNIGKKYTSSKANYYRRNKNIFITNTTLLKAFSLGAIFDDPIEAQKFASLCGDCKDCNCKDMYQYDLFVDRNLLDAITQKAYNRLVILFSQMREDKNSNASDDSGLESGRMIHQPNQQ